MAPVDRRTLQISYPFLLWLPPATNAEYFSERPEDAAWCLGPIRERRYRGARMPCARRPDGAPLPRPDSRTAVTLLYAAPSSGPLFACARWGDRGRALNCRIYTIFTVRILWCRGETWFSGLLRNPAASVSPKIYIWASPCWKHRNSRT
jgi:hypothetical protein